MSEKEIFSQILEQLKEINNTLQDLKSTIEANHEQLQRSVGLLESYGSDTVTHLESIESNTRQ